MVQLATCYRINIRKCRLCENVLPFLLRPCLNPNALRLSIMGKHCQTLTLIYFPTTEKRDGTGGKI